MSEIGVSEAGSSLPLDQPEAPRPTSRGPFATLIIGIALGALCWLPTGLAPLLPLAFSLMMRGLRGAATVRQAVRWGFWFGVVRYAVAAHFLLVLLRHGPEAIAFYLMAICYILPYAIAECGGAVWLEMRAGLPRSLGFALLWVVGEKLRAVGELSFPADPVAHAFGTAPGGLVFAGVIGPFGVTACLLLLGAGFDWLLQQAPRRWAVGVVATVSLLLFIGMRVGANAAPAPDGFRLGIVQPSATIEEKLALDEDQRRLLWPALWERLRRLTREAALGADLVVWPETARPGKLFFDNRRPFHDPQVEALAREVGVPILYGLELVAGHDGRVLGLYNGAALVWPDGRPGQWYGKQRLLPFAEGMPFGSLLGWDPAARAHEGRGGVLTLLGNFSAGTEPTILAVGPARIGVLICFEGLYPQLSRAYANHGANLLAVLTNDGWWGHSVFPAWHAQMVAARARETALPIVRAANNGVSSITNAAGRMTAHTTLDDRTVLHGSVALSTGAPTFYTRRGDIVVWLAAALLGLFAVRAVIRRV